MTRLLSKVRFEREETLWKAPLRLSVRKPWELVFLIWRPIKECLFVAARRTGARGDVETLRRARITLSIDVVGQDINVLAVATRRNVSGPAEDEFIELRNSFLVSREMIDYSRLSDVRAEVYRSLRLDLVDKLQTLAGIPFHQAICNIERWEETERERTEDPWRDDIELTLRVIIRKERTWPDVSTS